MTEKDILNYLIHHTAIFNSNEKLSIKEISDGNINYVFRIKSQNKSVIVKYASDKIRTSGNPLSTERNRIETNALIDENNYAKGSVPIIYHHDENRSILIMEDLYDYDNLRYALMNQRQFSTLGKDMTSFLTKTLLLSSDFIMDPKEKKQKVKNYINPMLCAITERLVFTEPYDKEINTNILTKENEEFLIHELYEDEHLKLEVAKLKYNFETKAQSLLHGDLHTGSIFVKEGSTKILDPEFAFYGPAGYDIGNIVANLIFAWTRCAVGTGNKDFMNYIKDTITQIIDGFKNDGMALLKEKVTDRMYLNDEFLNNAIQDILCDSAGMCGTELIRRIIGDAKVKDITTIDDIKQKCKAECFCVLVGKSLIKQRKYIWNANNYFEIMDDIWEKL